MDLQTRPVLISRVAAAVRDILENGDQVYLRSLAPAALLDACASELYFLGVLRQGDEVADAALRTVVAHQLATWAACPARD